MEKSSAVCFNSENDYKARLTVALRAARICVYEVDLSRQLYTFFENAEEIFGIPDEEVLEAVRPYSQLPPEEYQRAVSEYFSHPDDAEVISEAFQRILNGQRATYYARMKAGKSNFTWCKLDVLPIMENGRPVRMIGVIADISDIKRERDLLEQKTWLDGFTGLRNKRAFTMSIQEALKEAPEGRHGLLLMDIDDFKQFNDTYGHAVGDKVILETAKKFSTVFGGLTGRFGGDEFIAFIRNVQNLEQLRRNAETLTMVTCGDLTATNSIGIALCPDDGNTFEELFKAADQALYMAKRTKKRAVFAQPPDGGI